MGTASQKDGRTASNRVSQAARSGEGGDLGELRLEAAAVDGDAGEGVEEPGHGRHRSDLAELLARDGLIDIAENIKCNCVEYRRQFLPLGARASRCIAFSIRSDN